MAAADLKTGAPRAETDKKANADKLNDAIDKLTAAREELRSAVRKQSENKDLKALDVRSLTAIYRRSYVVALDLLRRVPPETDGLFEAIQVFLVGRRSPDVVFEVKENKKEAEAKRLHREFVLKLQTDPLRANDLGDFQAAGMDEAAAYLLGAINDILQKQVEFAYTKYQVSGRSVPMLMNLMFVFQEAQFIGVDNSTPIMQAAQMALNDVATMLSAPVRL
jgi:hypothetical protein